MPIPHEVHNLLWRVVRPSTRQALHDAFEDWERANRTLTRLVLQGAHRVPLAGRSALYLAGLFGNPLASLARSGGGRS